MVTLIFSSIFFSFRLAEKKAAIGFTYEDSNACPAIKDEEDDDSSDTDVETADLGGVLFIYLFLNSFSLDINKIWTLFSFFLLARVTDR